MKCLDCFSTHFKLSFFLDIPIIAIFVPFSTSTAVGTVIFGTALVAAVNYLNRKTKKTQPFKPTKNLGAKDGLVLAMLEDCKDGDKTPCYVITDPAMSDNPIVYASSGFCAFTKYTKAEIEGRNCRFLQGPNTDKGDVKAIRDAITAKKDKSVCLLNYKKDGTTFMNQFFITPLFDENGNVQYYLGVQKEVVAKTEMQDGQNPGWRIFMWL